ncbi:MAG: DUF6069 family protein [Actinomycetota bacterium]|nr:DUF6069 family protein [Actinomycetota bacterium]
MYDDPSYDRTQRIPRSPRVNARKLWAGGAATTLVAALTSFIALLVARGIFGIPVLAPTEAGVVGDATTIGLCSLGAAGALVATALMHLLLLTTPQPKTFFTIIAGLGTVALALTPFTLDAQLSTRIATALVYLATGGVIVVLVSSVADYAGQSAWD